MSYQDREHAEAFAFGQRDFLAGKHFTNYVLERSKKDKKEKNSLKIAYEAGYMSCEERLNWRGTRTDLIKENIL